MLEETFLLLPGIGRKRERALWEGGIGKWKDYIDSPPPPGISRPRKAIHDSILERAYRALGKDPTFFSLHLPRMEHWRAFEEFERSASYLDVETDERGRIVVVGVQRGEEFTQFVGGRDLDPLSVEEALRGSSILVTFNGSSFDLPLLRRGGVILEAPLEFDLCPALRRVGLAGGLKRIERVLGIKRGDKIGEIGAAEVPLLWRRYLRGSREALEQLLAYNEADVRNLLPLARFAVEILRRSLRTPSSWVWGSPTFGSAGQGSDVEGHPEDPHDSPTPRRARGSSVRIPQTPHSSAFRAVGRSLIVQA